MLSRRNFIRSAAGVLIAAPMVVKAESIMKVVSCKNDDWMVAVSKGVTANDLKLLGESIEKSIMDMLTGKTRSYNHPPKVYMPWDITR